MRNFLDDVAFFMSDLRLPDVLTIMIMGIIELALVGLVVWTVLK